LNLCPEVTCVDKLPNLTDFRQKYMECLTALIKEYHKFYLTNGKDKIGNRKVRPGKRSRASEEKCPKQKKGGKTDPENTLRGMENMEKHVPLLKYSRCC
jgi:hypothetical protein